MNTVAFEILYSEFDIRYFVTRIHPTTTIGVLSTNRAALVVCFSPTSAGTSRRTHVTLWGRTCHCMWSVTFNFLLPTNNFESHPITESPSVQVCWWRIQTKASKQVFLWEIWLIRIHFRDVRDLSALQTTPMLVFFTNMRRHAKAYSRHVVGVTFHYIRTRFLNSAHKNCPILINYKGQQTDKNAFSSPIIPSLIISLIQWITFFKL